jgi:hypothetical protein
VPPLIVCKKMLCYYLCMCMYVTVKHFALVALSGYNIFSPEMKRYCEMPLRTYIIYRQGTDQRLVFSELKSSSKGIPRLIRSDYISD